jgi:hypothetical protein
MTTPIGDRSYRFGPGAQGVLEGSMTWEDRFRVGLDLRPYLVVASGMPGGADAMTVGALSARYRIWGHHAIETSATHYQRRTVEADGRITHAGGSTLMVTWRWAVEPLGAGVVAG